MTASAILTAATEIPQEAVASQSGAEPQPAGQSAPKSTRILLIRHGLNEYVKKGLLAGRSADVFLNDDGLAQAAALAERLGDEKIAAVYTSPLPRCRQTAEPLAQRLGLELQVVEDVKETDCGDWTGQPLEELRKAEAWQHVQLSPSSFRFPNGESMLEIQVRIVAALERLRQEHVGETVAVVSHSDPIKLALAYHIGMPLDLFQRLEVSPASISELDLAPMRARLVRLNDCAHVPPAKEEPKAEGSETGEASEAVDSPAAKGALEEQVIKGPHGEGPEPQVLQLADEGKMKATGG